MCFFVIVIGILAVVMMEHDEFVLVSASKDCRRAGEVCNLWRELPRDEMLQLRKSVFGIGFLGDTFLLCGTLVKLKFISSGKCAVCESILHRRIIYIAEYLHCCTKVAESAPSQGCGVSGIQTALRQKGHFPQPTALSHGCPSSCYQTSE